MAKGHTVILTSRSLEKGQVAAVEIGEGAGAIEVIQLDVTDPVSIERAKETVKERFGRLDVLVNNAGIDYDRNQSVMNADMDRVRRLIDTNVIGVWEVTQAFHPLLRQSDHPRIVNVSSESGSIFNIDVWAPGYATSKAALNGLTAVMAREFASDGILVNAVCPGWIATSMGGPGRPATSRRSLCRVGCGAAQGRTDRRILPEWSPLALVIARQTNTFAV